MTQIGHERLKIAVIGIGRGSVSGRAVLEGKPVHVLDLEADPDYALKSLGRARRSAFL